MKRDYLENKNFYKQNNLKYNMKNKRGQGLSVNAIIMIVLGVIVLVILAVGFIAGWDKIAFWMSTNNVDTIAQQCSVACSTNSVYDYCSMERTLNDGKNKIVGNCTYFMNNNSNYGITNCSQIC